MDSKTVLDIVHEELIQEIPDPPKTITEALRRAEVDEYHVPSKEEVNAVLFQFPNYQSYVQAYNAENAKPTLAAHQHALEHFGLSC